MIGNGTEHSWTTERQVARVESEKQQPRADHYEGSD